MIPVTQTKVVVRNSKDELIVYGNCFAAVVASMLELPIQEVPNVETLYFLEGKLEFYGLDVMNVFLEGKGWELMNDGRFSVFHDSKWGIGEGYTHSRQDALDYCHDKYYLVSGKSTRGVSHICIYKNGYLVHDPHPTREGLISIHFFQTLERK